MKTMVSLVHILFSVITIILGLICLLIIYTLPKFKKASVGMVSSLFIRLSFSVVFLLLFSIWHFLRDYFEWDVTIGEFMEYPEYVFITLAYLMFLLSAIKMAEVATLYGFKEKE